ncbi:MAG: CoA transferase, partial [Desulfobacteraceae bacterium]
GRRIPHSLGMYPQSLFQCKDGYITAVCRSRQEWLRYIEAMGNPEWGQNPRYQDPVAICSYADEVDALLAPWLMEHTREEIQNIAKEFRIAVAPVRRVDEVLNDPHFRMRNCFTEVESEDLGRIGFPAPPYRFSRAPNKMPGMAPKLGQDNERVYCEFLGYSREKLVGLRRAGVI